MKEFIDKLIKRLKQKHIPYLGMDNSVPYGTEMVKLFEAISIVNQLAEEYSQHANFATSGWIPCSERLPEHMQTVLFTSEDGNVDCGWYDADKNWCVNDNYFPNAFRFIAWQPLPTPWHLEGGMKNETTKEANQNE